METTVLEAVYAAMQVESRDPLEMCTMCYCTSRILWPPSEFLETYLKSIGFQGDIRLCDLCMEDMGLWNVGDES